MKNTIKKELLHAINILNDIFKIEEWEFYIEDKNGNIIDEDAKKHNKYLKIVKVLLIRNKMTHLIKQLPKEKFVEDIYINKQDVNDLDMKEWHLFNYNLENIFDNLAEKIYKESLNDYFINLEYKLKKLKS